MQPDCFFIRIASLACSERDGPETCGTAADEELELSGIGDHRAVGQDIFQVGARDVEGHVDRFALFEENLPEAQEMIKNLAKSLGTVIAVSGVIDLVSDGERTMVLRNGCATMSRITGSGCMLTSMIGAFCGAMPEDCFTATVAAMSVMGISGEVAEARRIKNGTGNATFRTDLIDAVFNMTEEQLVEGMQYEIL